MTQFKRSITNHPCAFRVKVTLRMSQSAPGRPPVLGAGLVVVEQSKCMFAERIMPGRTCRHVRQPQPEIGRSLGHSQERWQAHSRQHQNTDAGDPTSTFGSRCEPCLTLSSQSCTALHVTGSACPYYLPCMSDAQHRQNGVSYHPQCSHLVTHTSPGVLRSSGAFMASYILCHRKY